MRGMTVVFNIRQLMRKKQKSVADIASAIGVTPYSVWAWCAGVANPPVRYWVPLTKALNCSLDEIIVEV